MTAVVATSVVRGAQQGDSHGGVYLVDFSARKVKQVIDWNTVAIDWTGRGWDRGLRGVACSDDRIYIAASDELFIYSRTFDLVSSHRCAWLKHCHEIFLFNGRIFLTSTGHDAILGFDTSVQRFDWGLRLSFEGQKLKFEVFDPEAVTPQRLTNNFHLNSVTAGAQGVNFAGLRTPGLLRFANNTLSILTSLPEGTHNARLFGGGILFNDTRGDSVRWVTPARQRTFPVPRFAPEDLENYEMAQDGLARQAFARGLCPLSDTLVVGGSSPSTLSLYDLDANKLLTVLTLSRDVRNAVHGLTLWPFGAF